MALPKLPCKQCNGTGEVGAGRNKQNCKNCGGDRRDLAMTTTTIGFHSITVTGGESGDAVVTVDLGLPAIRITAHVARRLLREVVAEVGRDRVIRDGCTYQYCGRPHCLVGQVLYRAGLTWDELDRMDRWTPQTIGGVKLPPRLSMSRPARRVLREAQRLQDRGKPWGVALDAALAVRPWQVAA